VNTWSIGVKHLALVGDDARRLREVRQCGKMTARIMINDTIDTILRCVRHEHVSGLWFEGATMEQRVNRIARG
jgi:hypothetical protein